VADRVFFSAKTGDSTNLWQVSISKKLADHGTRPSPDYRIGTGDSPVPRKNRPTRLFITG
jgi:hypothetical protein